MDRSPPGSSVHGILQARILVWVAISFSRGFSQPRDQICISCLAGRFFITEPPGKFSLTLHILCFLYYFYSFMQHITKSLSNPVQNHTIQTLGPGYMFVFYEGLEIINEYSQNLNNKNIFLTILRTISQTLGQVN